MSYLSPLRLHFAGRFQASVSTVNNDVTHFDNAAFKPAYQLRQDQNGPNGWWNPRGDAAWRLLGCQITAAFLTDGTPAAPDDPIRTARVADSDRRVTAKIADLDPQQQLVSMIFGLEVRIATATGDTLVRGRFRPAAFTDIWARVQGSGGTGDANAGAMWQSVIEDLEWSDASGSRFLEALRRAATDGLLSLKFNVDRYSMNWKGDEFCRGRIVGTLGPACRSEPAHFVPGRQFMAPLPPTNGFPSPPGKVFNGVAVVDPEAGKIRLDLGNALPSTASGDLLADIGALTLGFPVPPADPGKAVSWTILGAIPYLAPGWYETTAGIVELPAQRRLTAAELEALRTSPLTLFTQNEGGAPVPAISEPPLGQHVRADQFVARLSPGDRFAARLFATRYGLPLPGARLVAFLDASWLQSGTGEPEVATPASALAFPTELETDAQGVATLEIRASDPGNPRGYIDGQVYGVRCVLADTQPASVAYPFNPWDFISILLWDTFRIDDPPTWHGGLQAVFQQYANLYPVMDRFLDLGDYTDVCRNRPHLLLAFGLEVENPNAMPVTRDLSPAKRAAILRWLTDLGPDGLPRAGQPPATAARTRPAPRPLAVAPETHPGAPSTGGKLAALQRRRGARP